ncbi:hypothetical protein [Nocardioides sp.]|uniref:hypothetical protein n=1 Tax=Nocardioides sp. TaxID=35761 RepID=UPI0035176BC8
MKLSTLKAKLRREGNRVRAERAAHKLSPTDRCDPTSPYIVSLTTFPARVGKAHLALHTVLKGKTRPRAIVLVLSSDEFPQQSAPTPELAALQDRGLVLHFAPGNIRSYKKLLPVRDLYPDDPIITIDDDVLYPPEWLDELAHAHRETPDAIVGVRGREMLVHDNTLAPYSTWPLATPDVPSLRVMLTGMGGIVYPPRSLPAEAFDADLAMKLCPTADDIWFKVTSMLAGTQVRQATAPQDYLTVRSAQTSALMKVNVDGGRNDHQFRSALDHFGLWSALVTPEG